MTASNSLLCAIELALRDGGKPQSAKAIALIIQERSLALLGGVTPWKTVGARLAVDIRSNANSQFMRVGRGLYALREWSGLTEVTVPARKINPLEEDILVISREKFSSLDILKDQNTGLYPIDYQVLLELSHALNRSKAESTEDVIQLIPSFVIFRGNEVLTFKRTKKTPEERLHDSFSMVFGGHLQVEDNPGLFSENRFYVESFLFRELHEELEFSIPVKKILYIGTIYLKDTQFERQHAGVTFAVDLDHGTTVKSLEPGYQSTLQFMDWGTIATSKVAEDRWSQVLITHMGRAA